MRKNGIGYCLLAVSGLVLHGAVLAGELTVSAAASLTNAFKEIAQSYEVQYPDAKVSFNFGASGALLQQIAKGAPVDVLASADQETMDSAQKQGLVVAAERFDFVRNTLVVVVPADSRLHVHRLEDLNAASVHRIAIGNPVSVPVGRYTMRALESARLWPGLESKAISTQNVRQSLDYVARGEVDAGFVYATDAVIMKDKVRVAFDVPVSIPITYPIATIRDAAHREEARRFIQFVLQPQSQAILGKYGFLKP